MLFNSLWCMAVLGCAEKALEGGGVAVGMVVGVLELMDVAD